jgi:hypothetical protein
MLWDDTWRGPSSRKCHKPVSNSQGLRVYVYLNEREWTLSCYCRICSRCSIMAIVNLGVDPVGLWVDRVAIVSSLGLSCIRNASSTKQQSFQLVSPVFTITPYITCSFPTRKDLGGGGGSDLEILVANVVGHGTITPDRSMDHESDGRDTSLLPGSNGEVTKLSAASSFRGYACMPTRIAVNMHSS